jgi:pimeloyl-ACP methyl ester carboxylesterase
VFDNAGIGETSPLPAPLTVAAMADQTGALIRTLRLHRPTVVAEMNSPNPAVRLSVLFPADQAAAAQAYLEGVLAYPNRYTASATISAQQSAAFNAWMSGDDPAGWHPGAIRAPTLVADGIQDIVDPTSNDYLLAHSVPLAHLALFPDAGHAFLFQNAPQFIGLADRFVS